MVRPDKIPTSDEELLAIPVRPNYFVTLGCHLLRVHLHNCSTAERNMKNKSHDFLVEACRQVKQRLPVNIQIWKSMTVFSPTVFLSQAKQQLRSLSILKMQFLMHSIRPLHITHGQTRRTPRERHFGLKCSVTKTAVERSVFTMGQATLSSILHIK